MVLMWKGDGVRMQGPGRIPNYGRCVIDYSYTAKHEVNGSRIPERNLEGPQMMFLLLLPRLKPKFWSEYLGGVEDLYAAMGLKAAAASRIVSAALEFVH